MKLFKTVAFGLAAGVAMATLAMPVEKAEARVVAYSTLQVTDFLITQGSALIDLSTLVGTNTTSTSATLTGYAGAVDGDTQGVLANSDALASCTGQAAACAAAGQNNFNRYSAGDTVSHFARADAQLVGNILTPPGANAKSAAEVQLNTIGSGNASAGLITAAEFEVTFDVIQGGDMVLSFDAFYDIFLFSDELGSTATGDTQWTISLFDLTDGGAVEPILFSIDPATINNAEALFGPGTNSKSDAQSFALTVSGLEANHTYRFSLTHNTKVSATKRVPEPAALGLLGLGLLGLGIVSRRRRSV